MPAEEVAFSLGNDTFCEASWDCGELFWLLVIKISKIIMAPITKPTKTTARGVNPLCDVLTNLTLVENFIFCQVL